MRITCKQKCVGIVDRRMRVVPFEVEIISLASKWLKNARSNAPYLRLPRPKTRKKRTCYASSAQAVQCIIPSLLFLTENRQ